MDEVEILKSVSHPNIIGIEDVYDTDSNLYIVLELVSGGELSDTGPFPEEKCKVKRLDGISVKFREKLLGEVCEDVCGSFKSVKMAHTRGIFLENYDEKSSEKF